MAYRLKLGGGVFKKDQKILSSCRIRWEGLEAVKKAA